MMYNPKVMRRFMKPKFSGKLKNPDAIGKVANEKCGDIMKIYLKIDKKGNNKIIKDIRFQTLGCPAAVASSDALCELVKGKTIKEAEEISDKAIVKKLGGLPIIKVHCSVLGSKTLKKALENYQTKFGSKKSDDKKRKRRI